MSSKSLALANSLIKRFRALESTRVKIERLHIQGNFSLRDLERTYEGLYLNLHVAFESFLENLFIGLLVQGGGVESKRSDILPRVVVRSHVVARDLLFGTTSRNYIDWLPYNRTIQLAKVYFRGGRPFTDLTDGQRSLLARCYIIRNAIAHSSRYSMNKFAEVVVGSSDLPPREKKPVGYLRGVFRTSPIQTRFENYAVQLSTIAKDLAR